MNVWKARILLVLLLEKYIYWGVSVFMELISFISLKMAVRKRKSFGFEKLNLAPEN